MRERGARAGGTGLIPVHDLVIVGGGPAGLATALHATRAGFDVVVVEPRRAPVDKACGEGLMPGGAEALRELGIEVAGHPITGIRYVQGRREAHAAFRDGPGIGVRRTELHAALHRAVLDAGVTVVPEQVHGVQQDDSGVTALGPRLRGRWLVAADGLHSPVRRSLGLELPSTTTPRYGLRRHYALPPASSSVEVHCGPGGEAYVTPLGDELVGVALLTSERAPFETHLEGFPDLAARLADVEAVTGVRGAGPLRQRTRRRVHGRVLLVGDAAGYVDALTGEGIALALTGAEALVDALRWGEPSDYEVAWRRTTRRYRLLTECLVRARGRPALAGRIVPAAERMPKVFASVVNALA